jgi:HEAT repeat protein
MQKKPLKSLRKGDEDRRRGSLIRASRSGDRAYLPQLLKRLTDEHAEGNRRHVVRALGNIGGEVAVDALLRVLNNDSGLILGDAEEALGKLRCHQAIARLKSLAQSDTDWVAQKAQWALKQMQRES